MKPANGILALLCILCIANGSSGQSLSGIVFRDYNGNGQKNNSTSFNEPFVSGITVRAYNASNVQVGPTKTTNSSGAYSFTTGEIPNGTAVRVEFNGLAAGDHSSINGTQNGTNIQFVTTGAGVTANYAINSPDDYWNNTAQTNPKLLAILYTHGDINHNNATNVNFGIQQINNSTTNVTYDGAGNPTNGRVQVATQAQVGSVWGMGYQKTHKRYFFSSFLKRHLGLGPQGVGGVYMADSSTSTNNFAYSGSFTLQGVTPSGSGTGVSTPLNMGSVTRNTINGNDNEISTGADVQARDLDAFGKVGKMCYGDIDVDEKNQQLVLTNLFNRQLITVNISGGTASLNNATPAVLGPLTRAYDMATLPGWPTAIGGGQLRPFALKIYKGKGYLGVVSDASATQRDSTNLRGFILSFNPANIGAGFTSEIANINFNYRTSVSNSNTNRWHSWADVWADVRSSGLYRYPVPMITDIEFDELGGMNISITDRFGHQMGVNQPIAVAGSGTVIGEARTSGDLLRACNVAGAWVMEGTAGSCSVPNTAFNADGYGDGQTIGVYEYYDDRSGDGDTEFGQGALAKLMGSERLVNTLVDPMPQSGSPGEPYWYTAGMHWYNVNTGSWDNWVSLMDDQTGFTGSFLKGNGLGDIEFATNPEPIQIGNRIWFDTNGNGIQDAGETSTVADGTVVTLRSPGVNGIYGDGDDQTWTTTTTGGAYYFSTLSSADNRKPAAWAGVGNTLLPGYEYRIEMAVPSGYQISKTNAAANSFDNIDNDASLSGANAIVVFNTDNTNHNFDIGFKQLASLGDKVWRDDDKDGVQDAGEPGVAGVTVTLFRNGADGNPGTADDVLVSTTITDAYGMYLFDNLTPSTGATTQYNVVFTQPTNYTFTISSGTSEADATNSDANATTGRTTTIDLSNGENQRNIDCGLIFSQPASNSIGDKVWYDLDNDGVQDANEAGVSGVTITLYASDGVTIVATTITDANGNYIFTGLPASTNYILGITPPVGMVLTTSIGGTTPGNATTNSDFSQSTFKTAAVNTGAAGNQITGIDAGLSLQSNITASVGDRVWNDLNNNGIQDAGEPGVPNVTVNLYRDANADGLINGAEAATSYATTVTDAFGNYIFNNLPATAGTGTVYQVGFVLPGGYSFVAPNAGSDDTKDSDANTFPGGLTSTFPLKQGQRNLNWDAGITQNSPAGTARIGDKVWFDANTDGIQQGTETGVGGVTVTLYNSGGTAIATTATDVNGNYQFANLAAGTYSVGFSNLPAGYSFTSSTGTTSASGTTNSDVSTVNGRTTNFAITTGESLQGLDAGLIAGVNSGLASLGNRIWYDLNGNGLQDVNELGVSGITVLLKDAGADGILGNGDDGADRSTTTNALGEYMFTGLPAGNYAVQFGTATSQLPAGYTTNPNQGANDAIDSDGGAIASGISTTGVYVLAVGQDNLTVDLGITPAAGTNSVGNYVWFDNGAGGGTANDGIQNGTEAGVAGATVRLFRDANNNGTIAGAELTPIAITTTDMNGGYLFAGLADGSYLLEFSNLPAGFTFVSPDANAEGLGTDSDADLISGNSFFVNLDQPATNPASVVNLAVDAGITSTRAALGNYVWLDTDGNGTQLFDGTEPAVPGVTVTLYRPGFGLDGIAGNGDDALPVASMITDQNGQYLFSNLEPGTYEVEFSTIPGGLSFTQRNTPGDNGNNTNSDAVPLTGNPSVGRTTGIVLTAGETDLTIDAGLFKPRAVIGNYTWVDSNNNGTQDASEAPAPGLLISLIDAGGNVVAVAITDANGGYLFPNVAPGTYSMSFTNLPTGVSFTTANVGDDNFDSDVSGSTITGIVVTTTTVNLSFDAGLIGLITLPVRLEFFATKQGAAAQLNWKVTAERDVVSYTLERSANGQNFTAIFTANADGRSQYNTTDVQPHQGINYYRVKTMNLDGSIEYSNIRLVRFDNTGLITVFPVPANDKVNVQLPDSWQGQSVKIELINQAGQSITSRTAGRSSQVETINIDNIPAGTYYLKITGQSGTEIKRIQKIR